MVSNPNLEAGDRVFHEVYGASRNGTRHDVPVLVVLPNELVLQRGNTRQRVFYSRPSFAKAKAAAHIAVACFALSQQDAGSAGRRDALSRLRDQLSAKPASTTESRRDHTRIDGEIQTLLECCANFVRDFVDAPSSEQLAAAFAAEAGPRILGITELATCEQIAGLHEAVENLFRELPADELAELQVVVIGDHQARTRSLGVQYFKRRFQERQGADERVTYGENITDEQEAILLVATRRLDKRIARAFFGDENRLQRDVLGDAAKRCLEENYFPSR